MRVRNTGRLSQAALLFCLGLLASGPAVAALSEQEFHDPPIQARPSALWTWLNGYVELPQITRELEEMKAKGMRGAIIWDLGSISDPDKIIPAGPAFLGPESLKAIHHAMDEAERLGLELGMVAASSWNSGGPWITPEDASKQLLWSELEVKGPQEFAAGLPMPKKAGSIFKDVAVIAAPIPDGQSLTDPDAAIHLTNALDAQGKLTWSVPPGSWKILRFISNNTGEHLNCPSPNSSGLVIDHLSRKATDAHIDHILDTLLKGRHGFGPLKTLMLDSYEVRPATDWTPDFLQEFSRTNGYNPVPWLPALTGETVGSEELSKRFVHDYQKMVSDLMVKDHYARSREILNQRGLKLLAEAGHGGHARVDPLKALGAADIPMGEFWNHRKNWVTKEAASAAHIYGKNLVNSESLTGWQNWQDGPATYKRLFDIALCAGLNQVTFHTFAHEPPSAGLPGFAYHAGEHFNVNSTWWEQAGPMLKDMSRCCHLLQQGRFVADVCAYYGDDAPNLVPARRIAPTINSQWDEEHCAHCGRPIPVDLRSLGHGYDYDYVNEEVILTRMQVRDGMLVLPDGMTYRLLALPDREAISPAVLRRIGELVEAGATVVSRKPEKSNSLRGFPDCDREVRDLAARIWGDCDGDKIRSHAHGKGKVLWNKPLKEVLADMGISPDFTVEEAGNEDQHIDYIHRTTGDEEIYFVSNSSMTRQEVNCRFRVGPDLVPSFWHAEDGSVTECQLYETGDGFVRIPLDLYPASSVFVIFKKQPRPDHLVRIGRSTPTGSGAESISPAGAAIEIMAMNSDRIEARVAMPGTYRLETSGGKTGKIVVDQIPADREITGPWQLSFPEGRGAPPEATMPTLIDWTQSPDTGVSYFSGTATYHKDFDLPDAGKGPVILDLGSVKEVATLRVNGKEAGLLWKEPYQIDIGPFLKPGNNQLEISVTNLWNNRIVGDQRMGPGEGFTRTNLKRKFTAKSPLLPSGLIGPVKLRISVPVTIKIN
jgi:hypothetical protein